MAYDADPSATHNPATGGTPTAAWGDILNANFAAIGAAWTSYVPTWTGSITNPVINNGTLTGAYLLLGKTIHFRITVIAGSTTTYGSGFYSLSLPTGTSVAREQIVSASVLNASTTRYRAVAVIAASATALSIQADDSGNFWQPTIPFTFGTADTATVGGTIELA